MIDQDQSSYAQARLHTAVTALPAREAHAAVGDELCPCHLCCQIFVEIIILHLELILTHFTNSSGHIALHQARPSNLACFHVNIGLFEFFVARFKRSRFVIVKSPTNGTLSNRFKEPK